MADKKAATCSPARGQQDDSGRRLCTHPATHVIAWVSSHCRAGAWAEIHMTYTKSCQRSATSTFTSVTQTWCRRMQCVSHSRPMERWRGRLCQTAQATNTGPWSFAGEATLACLDAGRRREVQRHVETYWWAISRACPTRPCQTSCAIAST